MSKVSVMGMFTCQDGKAEEMEAVLAKMVEAASGEAGVEIYSYHRGEENTFWFFALRPTRSRCGTTVRARRCRRPCRRSDRWSRGRRR